VILEIDYNRSRLHTNGQITVVYYYTAPVDHGSSTILPYDEDDVIRLVCSSSTSEGRLKNDHLFYPSSDVATEVFEYINIPVKLDASNGGSNQGSQEVEEEVEDDYEQRGIRSFRGEVTIKLPDFAGIYHVSYLSYCLLQLSKQSLSAGP
jgi:hypothetical protein